MVVPMLHNRQHASPSANYLKCFIKKKKKKEHQQKFAAVYPFTALLLLFVSQSTFPR